VSSIAIWRVTAFYRFIPIDRNRLSELQRQIKEWMSANAVLGLVLVSEEGVNGTVAGGDEEIEAFRGFVRSVIGTEDIRFKDSFSEIPPFHRVSVDIRKEIVGLKRPDLVPESTEDHHLTPAEWHEAMASTTPKLVIDTRNRYETLVGKFAGAIDPDIKNFSEWGAYLDSAEIPSDIPVYIYCTGGIRCEKAILEMHQRGLDKVYQLRDGILGYLAEYPDGFYEGECFVFDDRVAVNRELKPTERFGICPGCGLTSETKRSCERCGTGYYVCTACEQTWEPVCSKECRDLWRRHGPKVRANTPV